MKKMRSRMIAHGGLTDVGVNYGVHFIAHAKCPPTRVLGTSSTEGAPSSRVFCGGWGFHDDLVGAYPLHRVGASLHLSDHGVQLITVKHAAIAHLTSGLGVERRVVEDNLTLFARLELLCALAVADDG